LRNRKTKGRRSVESKKLGDDKNPYIKKEEKKKIKGRASKEKQPSDRLLELVGKEERVTVRCTLKSTKLT